MEIVGKEKVIEKFCKEIYSDAVRNYQSLLKKFLNQLKRYNETEKSDFIQSQKKEIREYLEASAFEEEFPVIDNNEKKTYIALRNYFKNGITPAKGLLRQVQGWEYNEKVKKGDYAIDILNKVISVHPTFFLGKPLFNFCYLNSFKELPKYIAYNLLLIKLTKLQGDITKRYIIKNDDIIRQVFNICDEYDIVKCEYNQFRECIETTNFHSIEINRENVFYYTLTLLSYNMGKDWYGDACKTMKTTPSYCSGRKTTVKDYPEVKKLVRLLPKPEKE